MTISKETSTFVSTKKLKEELKEEKYDVSDFPDYEIHEQE